jgi:hypothetical protein
MPPVRRRSMGPMPRVGTGQPRVMAQKQMQGLPGVAKPQKRAQRAEKLRAEKKARLQPQARKRLRVHKVP